MQQIATLVLWNALELLMSDYHYNTGHFPCQGEPKIVRGTERGNLSLVLGARMKGEREARVTEEPLRVSTDAVEAARAGTQ